MYGKLKKRIAELEKQNNILANENVLLKQKYSEIIFLHEYPNKYDVSDKVKEGIILEKRIKDKFLQEAFVVNILSPFLLYEIAKMVICSESISENNLKLVKEILSRNYWEYRVFNETLKTEKWIAESNLNPL